MAEVQGKGVLPYLLLQGSALPEWAARSDSELLAEYIHQRSELAFAALVRRHGPMVWNVCYRFLQHYQDAEDAFQATFLVLAKRAQDVQPPEMLANWLYGVARHTAQKAREMAAKRQARGRGVPMVPEIRSTDEARQDELVEALYEELAHLPGKFRAVVVLCDLEGQSRKEAARQLKVPEGTVAGWLARARKMLARRLAHRGWAVSTVGIAALLAENATAAPYQTMFHTVRAASLVSAGQSLAETVSAKVAVLVAAVVRSLPGASVGVLVGGSACLLAALVVWAVSPGWFVSQVSWLDGSRDRPAQTSQFSPHIASSADGNSPSSTSVAVPTVLPRASSIPEPVAPELIPILPKEKSPAPSKAKHETPRPKKPDLAKTPPRKKALDEDNDDDDPNKVEGMVSEIDWEAGTLTIQRVQQRRLQQRTYRLGRSAQVWHKGKLADMTLLTRGAWVQLELSPKDHHIVLVKLKPRPKTPDEKKT